MFNRQKFDHKIIDNSTFSSSASFDDEIHINTQSGSQWDGLRHVINTEAGALYNGVKKAEVTSSTVLGLDSKTLVLSPRVITIDLQRVAQARRSSRERSSD